MSAIRPCPKALAREVSRWNEAHGVGTPVRYWPGLREGDGQFGVATTSAAILGGHTAGIYIAGAGFIALSHVEAIDGGGL